jgi:hypothetical protein
MKFPPGSGKIGGFGGTSAQKAWYRAFFPSLYSPFPFVGAESHFGSRSHLFIQVIQCTFTEHL